MGSDRSRFKFKIIINIEDRIRSCGFIENGRQIVVKGYSGQILIYDIENLPAEISIVTARRDLDNHIIVRCNYCGKMFIILENKLGTIVNCPHCNEELQLNDFIAEPIIIEDEKSEPDNFNISDKTAITETAKNHGDSGSKVENIPDNKGNTEKSMIFLNKEKEKKGFFSRLFRK